MQPARTSIGLRIGLRIGPSTRRCPCRITLTNGSGGARHLMRGQRVHLELRLATPRLGAAPHGAPRRAARLAR
eukprot:6202192-Pleurochrysis_carterae.AAC.1